MIRKLSNNLINQIAAGEVVERPASVLKELLENSIDAGATNIEIKVVEGGKSLISVKDNGCGISKDDLPLAIERHATSKLNDDNLFNVHTFGFRGEALASICSIARVSIKSKADGCEDGYELVCEDGKFDINFAQISKGTCIEVKDLFYATPARLKFLKSTNTESDACYANFVNIALANPGITFRYFDGGREKIALPGRQNICDRVNDLFGEEFIDNTEYIDVDDVSGFVGLPTYNRSSSMCQRFFVNGRCVKDKNISSAVKNAYKEVVPNGRYPVCLLFLKVNNEFVDVNVHPAKTEVRFRDVNSLMGKICRVIKGQILGDLGKKATNAVARLGLSSFVESSQNVNNVADVPAIKPSIVPSNVVNELMKFSPVMDKKSTVLSVSKCAPNVKKVDVPSKSESDNGKEKVVKNLISFEKYKPIKLENDNEKLPILPHDEDKDAGKTCSFGNAVCQIDNSYILSINDGELTIIDQHAICERITLEKLLARESIDCQQLLLPCVISLTKSEVECVMENIDFLTKLGMQIEKISSETICVRGVPAILGECDIRKLTADLIDELANFNTTCTFENKIRLIYATMACHRSVRAGKSMKIEEMNALLRLAEKTKNIAQCCHGRPSYIKLTQKDLKKMFER